MRKELSESAQWFLSDLRKILDDFALETKSQVALIDRNGNLVFDFLPNLRICQKIWKIPEGKVRCCDHFKIAYSVTKKENKIFFLECYAGFASIWLPIMIGDSFLGVLINCGGRIEKNEKKEKLLFSKLADELNLIEKDYFIEEALSTKISDKENIEKRIERLKKLIEILKEHTLTPLKEVFD